MISQYSSERSTVFAHALAYFEDFSRIYRPSGREDAMRSWLIDWAKHRNYATTIDNAGNLLIRADADNDRALLCLQSHMDMVCVGPSDKDWRQGVETVYVDGVIRAHRSSLGADNGVGIAAMLAVADSDDRPPLELLFTTAEEIGLVGAQKLDLPLNATQGINLDWSNSKTIGIGCAGVLMMKGRVVLTAPHRVEGTEIRLVLQNMRGGHSGMDIGDYRGNAIMSLCEFFKKCCDTNLRERISILDLSGGDADNAIPRSAQLTLIFTGHLHDFKVAVDQYQHFLRERYRRHEIALTYEVMTPCAQSAHALLDLMPMLDTVLDLGTGVYEKDDQKNPISSWNLGVASLDAHTFHTTYSLRSNRTDGIGVMRDEIQRALASMEWEVGYECPVWLTDKDSSLVHSIAGVFLSPQGEPLPARTTHAAAEVSILAQKYPHIAWVSVGPTISDMHTTQESVRIDDFSRFVDSLDRLLSLLYTTSHGLTPTGNLT